MNRDTDRWVRSAEAQAKFRELLNEVEHQREHVYILRYDTPAAVMVPVEWYERMAAMELPDSGLRAIEGTDPLDRVMKRLAGMPEEGSDQ